ncbi:uncharacterized protein BYT42DRAFT_504476 [Radiomyces spectabilis]|uniref:uncharacterized protein n=1 Tax=Radiomyces spectabilis TaxID=64574 RepID=UPI0022206D52|nr:uncharacterized protein BYT42DRAFT_504476 [Radiomyces spectabilis]KAI8367477.1 hypothetical protein BYT42DRAFT_504476 [Radiomyces spectabilis]
MLVSFIFYFWFTEWHKVPPQQRREEELEHQKEIDQLVQNLKEQIKCTFKIPLGGLVVLLWKATHSPDLPVSREHRKVLAHKFYHLFSVLFLVAVFVALFTLIGADVSPVSDNTSNILQAALFVFVLCINLFLITRQRFYYKDRKDLFGHDDAHLKAVYKTRFTDWDSKMWSNWIQIIILIIEFFQLLTFPLRDLMTVTSFDSYRTENQTQFTHLLTLIMNAGGLMPDMRTPTWYTYSVWTAFATTMVSLVVAVIVHTVNVRRPYKIPNRWVRWCIPVASLLYIPILTTFVSSAACQSLNISTNDYASTLRCYAPQISHKLYLWLSLVGYVIAYCLLTLFLTSYERIPRYNEIAFKSISVAIIKNMGKLMCIAKIMDT